jgi:hypothetical protein
MLSPFCAWRSARSLPGAGWAAGRGGFLEASFTRHGNGEVLLFDPIDPATIYRVLRAGETEQDRAWVGNERTRIAAEYDLVDDESRVRSQRGAKNLGLSAAY